jgi:hypothetical protein
MKSEINWRIGRDLRLSNGTLYLPCKTNETKLLAIAADVHLGLLVFGIRNSDHRFEFVLKFLW